jgi:hypothetical protein
MEAAVPHLLLILEEGDDRRSRPEEKGRDYYDRMVRFGESLKARGVYVASDALRTDATRVEIRDGRKSVVDGPFAEAKEIVGGFFLLDCGREEALTLAAECPAAEWATVEVREVGRCWET